MASASFLNYKQNRKKETARLQSELNKTANPKEAYKDPRMWQPTVDKAGNGSAIIRFLPARSPDEDAYVTRLFHSFKGPTGLYYIENCRSMLGKDVTDPVLEYNEALWNGTDSEKKQASAQKKKVKFISNILVISDEKNPQNEGKVFLYEYGKKTLERLNKLMNPTPDQLKMGKKRVDPFDLFEGVNYHLIVTKKDGFPNYDDSEFSSVCPVSEDENELDRIFQSMYDLRPLVAPETVKSEDELRKRLYKVLGLSGVTTSVATDAAAKPKAGAVAKAAPKQPVDMDEDDSEDSSVDVDSLLDELKN